MFMYVRTHNRIHIHIHIHTHIQEIEHLLPDMTSRLECICVCVHTYIFIIHVYMHVCEYTHVHSTGDLVPGKTCSSS